MEHWCQAMRTESKSNHDLIIPALGNAWKPYHKLIQGLWVKYIDETDRNPSIVVLPTHCDREFWCTCLIHTNDHDRLCPSLLETVTKVYSSTSVAIFCLTEPRSFIALSSLKSFLSLSISVTLFVLMALPPHLELNY